MPNVLITGESGFLGRIFKHELIAEGYRAYGLPEAGDGARIDIAKPFDLANATYLTTVIHAAGKAHSVPRDEKEKQSFYDVNFDGTKNLCLALQRAETLPECFIYISTVAVYGAEEGTFISENHPLNGHTPYADSKILAEEWLRHWADEHSVKLGILRLPLIVGPNPPGNLGAMIKGIKSGKYLSIGQARARKSMVWAEDVARIIPILAEKGGTFNLTDGHHPTFGELEEAIAKTLDKRRPLKIPHWAAKGLALAGDIVGSRFPINSDKLRKITSTLTFDDSKARNILGWNPTPVLSKIHEIV